MTTITAIPTITNGPSRHEAPAASGASLLTAAAVAVSGVVGFVGLVVPHAMRRVVGPLHRGLIPAVAFTGGGFLVRARLPLRAEP